MTSNRPSGRPSSGGSVPPTSRRSARQQRMANREANRALARSGTRGSSGNGLGPLLLWSLVFVVVAAVVVGGAYLLSQSKGSVSFKPITPVVVTQADIPSNDRTLGSPLAPVTIDLYGDFRCSACFVFTIEGTEKSLEDNYISAGKAKLVWHDFLTIDKKDGSTESNDAANAAWCAADQGKFWTMHDWLYANQSPTESPSAFTKARLSEIGKAAGLDMTQFQPCLDDGTHNAAIAAEQTGAPSDVAGTPTVYVNQKYVGDPTANLVPSYDEIKAAIDAALGSPSPSPSLSPSIPASATPSVKPS